MPTFSQNIERLRSGSRASTKSAMENETAAAQLQGEAGIEHTRNINRKLEPFSKGLRDWKKLDIAHQEKLGRRDARKARKEQLARVRELEGKISNIET